MDWITNRFAFIGFWCGGIWSMPEQIHHLGHGRFGMIQPSYRCHRMIILRITASMRMRWTITILWRWFWVRRFLADGILYGRFHAVHDAGATVRAAATCIAIFVGQLGFGQFALFSFGIRFWTRPKYIENGWTPIWTSNTMNRWLIYYRVAITTLSPFQWIWATIFSTKKESIHISKTINQVEWIQLKLLTSLVSVHLISYLHRHALLIWQFLHSYFDFVAQIGHLRPVENHKNG